jgi:ABC-type branched-subunit amino acid transport system permease subunit
MRAAATTSDTRHDFQVIRPEAVIGVFLLSGLAFYVVAWDEKSPLYVESTWALLALTALWWSLGWALRRAGAPTLGKAWLYGAGAFVAAYLGLVVMVVFSSGG